MGGGTVGEVGGRGGWAAISKLYLTLGQRQQCCVFRNRHNQQDRPRQLLVESSLAPCILINTIHWLHNPVCSIPLWFDRISKKLSVKAGLAICNYILGVSGWCKNRALMLAGFQLLCHLE